MSIQRYGFDQGTGFFGANDQGAYVAWADHVTSHSLDEQVEAQKFMAIYPIPEICEWDAAKKKFIRYTTSDRLEAEWGDHYLNHFDIWLTCAKSRAER